MYIGEIHIMYYLVIGILGMLVGQAMDWCNIRLENHKKVLSKEFFNIYLKNFTPRYYLMFSVAITYIVLLYKFSFSIDLLKYLILIPMLISVIVIDKRKQIIPNRLTLTMFEVGLVFMFLQGYSNMNLFADMLLGMIVGGGIFLLITLIGGAIAGKEAMGFGDVKLMGALGLFLGWTNIIMIALIAFLLGAIISIILIVSKKKKGDEYIPFGPFIVMAAFIIMIIPTDIMFTLLVKVFTLGMYKG